MTYLYETLLDAVRRQAFEKEQYEKQRRALHDMLVLEQIIALRIARGAPVGHLLPKKHRGIKRYNF